MTPNKLIRFTQSHLFIYAHGGAYVFGGGPGSAGEAATIAATAGVSTISIDYRMPPDHPFPAAVENVVTVYKALLKDHPAKSMAIDGALAGGGLSLASVHKFKALNCRC